MSVYPPAKGPLKSGAKKRGNESKCLGSGVKGGVTAHSQAALARHPLHGHPSHHPGPVGMKQGQRGVPVWLVSPQDC